MDYIGFKNVHWSTNLAVSTAGSPHKTRSFLKMETSTLCDTVVQCHRCAGLFWRGVDTCRVGWDGMAQHSCGDSSVTNTVWSELSGRKAETGPGQLTHVTGRATTPKANYSKTQRWFERLLVFWMAMPRCWELLSTSRNSQLSSDCIV